MCGSSRHVLVEDRLQVGEQHVLVLGVGVGLVAGLPVVAEGLGEQVLALDRWRPGAQLGEERVQPLLVARGAGREREHEPCRHAADVVEHRDVPGEDLARGAVQRRPRDGPQQHAARPGEVFAPDRRARLLRAPHGPGVEVGARVRSQRVAQCERQVVVAERDAQVAQPGVLGRARRFDLVFEVRRPGHGAREYTRRCVGSLRSDHAGRARGCRHRPAADRALPPAVGRRRARLAAGALGRDRGPARVRGRRSDDRGPERAPPAARRARDHRGRGPRAGGRRPARGERAPRALPRGPGRRRDARRPRTSAAARAGWPRSPRRSTGPSWSARGCCAAAAGRRARAPRAAWRGS